MKNIQLWIILFAAMVVDSIENLIFKLKKVVADKLERAALKKEPSKTNQKDEKIYFTGSGGGKLF